MDWQVIALAALLALVLVIFLCWGFYQKGYDNGYNDALADISKQTTQNNKLGQ